jgi:hypothetical protein
MQFQSKQIYRESPDPEKDSCTILTMVSLLNVLLLTIQYIHQHYQRLLGRLLSEERQLGVESAQWWK